MKAEPLENINTAAYDFGVSVVSTANYYYIRVGIEVNRQITVHSQENPAAKNIMNYLFDLMKN